MKSEHQKYGRFSIRYQAIVHLNRLQHYCSTTNLTLLSYSKSIKKHRSATVAEEGHNNLTFRAR